VDAARACRDLLDGIGTPPGSDNGCIHGVPWFVQHLGAALLGRLATESQPNLTRCLADAITKVASQHDSMCDLSHAGTPSATVLAVKQTPLTLDYLVLADSVLVVDLNGDIQVISDTREAQIGSNLREAMDTLPGGTPAHTQAHREYVEALRTYRNQPGGFWVADARPDASTQAVTGSLPGSDVRAVVLLSDGASRLVDRFGMATWSEALKILDTSGPIELLRRVREAEQSDPDGARWPRGKPYDDATIAYWRFSHDVP
jgi:hypothetical protein